jgi:ssDNA-binding Zn-finger/Zn-ribbon topoisomerase 1
MLGDDMKSQRFTKFDDAKNTAKSLPGSIMRRDGDCGWIITVPDSAVKPKATPADPIVDSVVEPKAASVYSVARRLCELCGKSISEDRIEALPNTTKCIECQSASERREDPVDDDLGSCPRCGRPLVWRLGALPGSTTKYFIGCSGYESYGNPRNCYYKESK